MKVIPFPTTETNLSVPVDRSSEKLYNEKEAAALAQRAAEIALSEMRGKILYLDNSVIREPVETDSLEGEPIMRRIRVKTGEKANGEAIYIFISGCDQDELNDKIVMTYVRTGRIMEFMDADTVRNTMTSVEQKQCGSDSTTFREYAERWLELYKSKKIRPTTMVGYRTILNHFYPAFGDMRFAEISTATLQEFLNAHHNLAEKYLKDMMKFMSSICKDAIEDGVITTNPAASRRLTIPSEKVTVREALTKEEFTDILQNLQRLPERRKTMMALFCLTGMRRGEVLGLRWEDIDKKHGLIHVRRSVTYAGPVPIVGDTKTENGLRSIPLTDKLLDYLNDEGKTGYVICSQDPEKPICYRSYNNDWRRIASTIDVHGATPHILRHTYLTFLASLGTDPKTISAIAGHADIQITMNRYVHKTLDNIQRAGTAFEAFCAEICAEDDMPKTQTA